VPIDLDPLQADTPCEATCLQARTECVEERECLDRPWFDTALERMPIVKFGEWSAAVACRSCETVAATCLSTCAADVPACMFDTCGCTGMSSSYDGACGEFYCAYACSDASPCEDPCL